jgi:hypothetical protein
LIFRLLDFSSLFKEGLNKVHASRARNYSEYLHVGPNSYKGWTPPSKNKEHIPATEKNKKTLSRKEKASRSYDSMENWTLHCIAVTV